MYRKPYVVGVDQTLAQAVVGKPDQLIQSVGRNTGNIIFSEALYNCVENATRGNFQFTLDNLEGHDCIILAAANWLNPYEDFGPLLERLEKTKVPIFIIGLGAQAKSTAAIPELKPNTRRLVEIIAERSPYLSVRGQFSAEVLEHYGITNVMVTGCPSLLLCGDRGPRIRALRKKNPRNCVISSTRHLMNGADPFQLYLYRQAFKKDYYIALQSELADYLMMSDECKLNEENIRMLMDAYGATDREALKSYLKRKGVLFSSLREWLLFLSKMEFCLGTRVHGTIASLLAGTPATLITHDERTRELARFMNIPHLDMKQVNTDCDLTIADFYSKEKMSRFVNGYKTYRENFRTFFKLNGLSLVDPKPSLSYKLKASARAMLTRFARW